MKYQKIIQESIRYVELHLHDKITLEEVSNRINYSKYHFHRVFKNQVGINFYDYIRKRRLANASKLLIYSDMKILDIALLYQFDSHEAFTRSFQSLYRLSPSRYRNIMRAHILNKNQEEKVMENLINGWQFVATDLDKYEISRDFNITNQSEYSIKIESKMADIDQSRDFSNFMQTFQAKHFLAKRMRFSAFIKSQDITGWSGLWMRIDDNSYNMLGFDNMSDRPIKGSTSWNHYACVLDIPSDSKNINIGLILAGSGSAWLDCCKFEEVNESVPTTDIRKPDDTLPDMPINLDLE
ncbi:AraC-type DNA-binding protein [Anaerosphaera aminiphila DSM 21120]|uniref:AraC-type DNA-binding protein n=1 Tax=Anaerosphaera aminiphila DSM 21120 TaxID=1120995 RepID=A0A1M5V3Y1_9FIRM|nr:helix-turn-helix transcriptional regulator [Anaerosphaera aminiphila]SHH69962.1 AraC-type DNA-binding protein [Anaerosphaera aminiphila DSM 21120]